MYYLTTAETRNRVVRWAENISLPFLCQQNGNYDRIKSWELHILINESTLFRCEFLFSSAPPSCDNMLSNGDESWAAPNFAPLCHYSRNGALVWIYKLTCVFGLGDVIFFFFLLRSFASSHKCVYGYHIPLMILILLFHSSERWCV